MTDTAMRALPGRDACLHLADGRRLTYRLYGADTGPLVIALHGTPGSRLKFASAHAPAERVGLRLAAPDRWAYGGSDAPPAASLATYAADVGALADHLGATRFSVLGVSGGGPYAAACAASLGPRIAAAAFWAPVGPLAGEPPIAMSPLHRFCFGPLGRRPWAVRAIFRAYRRLLTRAPGLALRLATANGPAADRGVIGRGDVAARLAATFSEGLRAGGEGPAIDLGHFARRWELPFAAATAPAKIWIGSADRSVPLPAARRLADVLPHGALEVVPDAGHLWAALNYDVFLGWLAETQKGAAEPRP